MKNLAIIFAVLCLNACGGDTSTTTGAETALETTGETIQKTAAPNAIKSNVASINGVSFKDFAIASANSVAGMPDEKIASILDMKPSEWSDTISKWNAKMSELSHDDMAYYAEAFTNPKQGRFANVKGAASTDEALDKVPTIQEFAKIFEHMAAAEEHDIDSVEILKDEYNLNLVEWSKAAGHWSQILVKASSDNDVFEEYYLPHDKASKKWANHFKEIYDK